MDEDRTDPPPAESPPPTTKAKPKPKASAEDDAKQPVSMWLKVKFPDDVIAKKPRPTFDRWKHAVAAALHCWDQHAHHAGEEMKLTEADYDKAVTAAIEHDDKGNYSPHKPALSEHADKLVR